MLVQADAMGMRVGERVSHAEDDSCACREHSARSGPAQVLVSTERWLLRTRPARRSGVGSETGG